MATHILIHPGLYNSAPGHWQSHWETLLPNASRVQQADWDRPDRAEWVSRLDAAIGAATSPVIIVAHSLGCITTAWWASERGHEPHAAKVRGALLVAPPDVERADFPAFITGFDPVPRHRLPFRSIAVASSNDPWSALSRAQSLAADWGAEFHAIGAYGHINENSGLGDWPQGRAWLAMLTGD